MPSDVSNDAATHRRRTRLEAPGRAMAFDSNQSTAEVAPRRHTKMPLLL